MKININIEIDTEVESDAEIIELLLDLVENNKKEKKD